MTDKGRKKQPLKSDIAGQSIVDRYYRDILEITKTRCFARIKKIRRVMVEYDMSIPSERVHFESVLKREIMGYQLKLAKSKSSYHRDIF